MPREDAPIVDIFTRQPLSRKARRAEEETNAVKSGTIVDHPITMLVHIKGDGDPFPRKWQWGKIVLDGTRPAWQRLRLGSSEAPIPIPEDAKTTGPARPIFRSELSAFCPHPRKSLIVPLVTGDTQFWIGVPRHSVETLILALEQTRYPKQRPASPGSG
jgi:hypothetical protein